jgi:hypothetical protein
MQQSEPPKEEATCLVCCTIRTGTLGSISLGLIGGMSGALADLWKYRHRTNFKWSFYSLPRGEAMASALFLGGGLTLAQIAYYSAHFPTSNKGCDTDIPLWSWNGCSAGAISGPFAGLAYYFTRYEAAIQRTPKFLAKSLLGGFLIGTLLGGLVAQDYWRFVVVDQTWGNKCQPPHTPRYFPPARD